MSKVKKLALVLEDEKEIQKLIKNFLKEDYDIVECLTGREAIGVITNDFDLQIIDIETPVMNGLEYLEELKRKGIYVPYLIITGYTQEFKDLEDVILRKPFSKKELKKKLFEYRGLT